MDASRHLLTETKRLMAVHWYLPFQGIEGGIDEGEAEAAARSAGGTGGVAAASAWLEKVLGTVLAVSHMSLNFWS